MAEQSIWKRGILVGMIGAVTVAVWFLIIDVITGRPLFTPATLGSAIFLGVEDLDQVEVSAVVVLGYTVVHLVAFILLGLLVLAITRRARKTPPLVLGALLVFVVLQALFIGLLAIAAQFLLGAIAWWSIAVGNLLAGLAMGYFIWQKDPSLREAVRREPFNRKH
ncbi:MAG: hypothetical protein EA350_06975 [Gemmatimonadales bacterium]|nr:MAG: hypothetical protein EA350_06975 [Gemmatimonadales bacterium]